MHWPPISLPAVRRRVQKKTVYERVRNISLRVCDPPWRTGAIRDSCGSRLNYVENCIARPHEFYCDVTRWLNPLSYRSLPQTPCSQTRLAQVSALSPACGNKAIYDLSTVHVNLAWILYISFNRPFPACCEPHFESEAKCKAFIIKISYHSYANKANFYNTNFVLSLAFIMRFTAARKWPICLDFFVSFTFFSTPFQRCERLRDFCSGSFFNWNKCKEDKLQITLISLKFRGAKIWINYQL